MSTATQEEFEMGQQAQTDWCELHKKLANLRLSLIDTWKGEYGKWKATYKRFRELEHLHLYQPTESGETPKPSPTELRYHKTAIIHVLRLGQQCMEMLITLPNLSPEEKDEQGNCMIQMETLLCSLRESLQLWHPANKNDHDPLRRLFQ